MAIPTKDSLLIAWGLNFDTKATASPVMYGLTAPQALSFHTAYQAFLAAYNAVTTANAAGTRSKLLTQNKDNSKDSLLGVGRQLYAFVQDNTSVTSGNKEDIGVVVRSTSPTPVPVPDTAPEIDILSTSGNTVRIRLHAEGSTKRGRPSGVNGAAVYSFVGASAPTEEAAWNFEGITGKTEQDITFPASVAPGARVWFTAFWFNTRKENGPAATPVGCNIPGNAAMAA
jgi:hypothetical protein